MTIKYFKKGDKTYVMIPAKQWEAYQKRMDRLEHERKFRNNLKNAFSDINDVINDKKKGVTLEEFLNEL